MLNIEEKDFIEVMLDLFKGREDCFSQQLPKTFDINDKISKVRYKPIKRAMNYLDMENHTNFKKTYGMYLITINEGCNCFVIDLDYSENRLLSLIDKYKNERKAEKMIFNKIKEDAKKQYDIIKKMDLEVFIEFSGSKGYHIWGFFEEEIPLEFVKMLEEKMIIIRDPLVVDEKSLKKDSTGKDYTDEKYEFYPKQESMEELKLGSIIKIPLGKHIKTDMPCFFVDPDTFKPILNQRSFITDIYYNKRIKTKKLEEIIGKIEFKPKKDKDILRNVKKGIGTKLTQVNINDEDIKSTEEIKNLFLSPYDANKNIIQNNINSCPPCIYNCYKRTKELSGQFLTRIIITHYLSSKKYNINEIARFFKYEINDDDDNKNPKLLNYYVSWAYGNENDPYRLENCLTIQKEGLCPNIINKIKKEDIKNVKIIDEKIREIIKEIVQQRKETDFFLNDYKENESDYTTVIINNIIEDYYIEKQDKLTKINKLLSEKEKIFGSLICKRTISPLSPQSIIIEDPKSIKEIKELIEKKQEEKKEEENIDSSDEIIENNENPLTQIRNTLIKKNLQTTLDKTKFEKKKFIKSLNSDNARIIFKDIESYIENNNNILVVKLPPAVGKTYLTGNACYFNKDHSYIFFAASHPLLDDMNKNIKKANNIPDANDDFFYHIYGKGQHDMCINQRGIEFINRYKHSSVFCNKCDHKETDCPYYNMVDNLIADKNLSWAGHFNHYYTLYDILRKKYADYDKNKIIIFDEEFLGNFFVSEDLDTDQIVEYLDNITNDNIRNVYQVILDSMEEKHQLYLKRNKNKESEEYDIKKEKEKEDIENNVFYRNIINTISNLTLDTINKEETDYDEIIYDKFNTLRPLNFKNPCLFLKEFYEYRKNSTNRKNIITFSRQGAIIHISYSRFIYESNNVIILNATCDEEIIKKLVINGNFNIISMEGKFQPNQKIYQITPHEPIENTMDITELYDKAKNRNVCGLKRYYNKKNKIITKNFEEDINCVKQIIQSHYLKYYLHEPKFLIICRQLIEKFVIEELKKLKEDGYTIDVIHYNSRENVGVNKFEDYNVVILFGSLCISSYDVTKKSDILDISYASILRTMREARMVQGLHRIRAFKPIIQENGTITYKDCFIFILTSLNLNLDFVDKKKSYFTGSLNSIIKKIRKMDKEKKEDVEYLSNSLKMLKKIKNKGFITVSELNNLISSNNKKEIKYKIIHDLTIFDIIKWDEKYTKLIPSMNFEKELKNITFNI
jgi:hypothetical protein